MGMRFEGPLGGYAPGFAGYLESQGYTPKSITLRLSLMAHLSRWLAAEGLAVREFDTAAVAAYVQVRRATRTNFVSSAALDPLLVFLRDLGVLPSAAAPTLPTGPGESTLAEFGEYLRVERGMRPSTVRYYVDLTRVFVRDCWAADGSGLTGLGAADVARFIGSRLPGMSVGMAKLTVSALRSFLRFAQVRGIVAARLDGAVPAVAGWRLAGLPKRLTPAAVTALLASCDRSVPKGRRDYAVLLMLSRLGLRAAEVAALTLDDIDWRNGTLLVHGKGDHTDLLPLPTDVGSALADYLARGRVQDAATRSVFLRARAPIRGFTRTAVGALTRRAALRAGFTGPAGPHRLRHTVASTALNAGASLEEVGQLLRHQSARSTAIYAKLDQQRLSALVQPWPIPVGPDE